MQELTKKGKILEIFFAVVFVLIGVSLRLLPHPPNFSPISAIALFGGVYFSRKIALILPIIAMAVSDFFIGFYDFRLMSVVYLSFILCAILGIWLRSHKKWQNIMGCSFIGSFIFYILTNFAVWAFSGWYSKNLLGLAYTYYMALPFFKNSLLSDIFFIALFFGLYELVEVLIRKKYSATKIVFANNF